MMGGNSIWKVEGFALGTLVGVRSDYKAGGAKGGNSGARDIRLKISLGIVSILCYAC